MIVTKTNRGFEVVEHDVYPPKAGVVARIIQESSAVGIMYPDSFDKPGSSFLWVGDHHHLNREEVAELVAHMQRWLETGSLQQ